MVQIHGLQSFFFNAKFLCKIMDWRSMNYKYRYLPVDSSVCWSFIISLIKIRSNILSFLFFFGVVKGKNTQPFLFCAFKDVVLIDVRFFFAIYD